MLFLRKNDVRCAFRESAAAWRFGILLAIGKLLFVVGKHTTNASFFLYRIIQRMELSPSPPSVLFQALGDIKVHKFGHILHLNLPDSANSSANALCLQFRETSAWTLAEDGKVKKLMNYLYFFAQQPGRCSG